MFLLLLCRDSKSIKEGLRYFWSEYGGEGLAEKRSAVHGADGDHGAKWTSFTAF